MTYKCVSSVGGTILLLMLGFAAPRASSAQISIYAEGTASDLNNGTTGTNFLYGGTAGVLLEGPTVLKHMIISADVKSRYIDKDGYRLISVLAGPRFSFPINKFKLSPYAEFDLGFARYRDGPAAGSENTTDNQWQAEGGVSRQLTPRIDVVGDFGYSQYGANNGEYNPKNISAGILFHFVKR